MPHESASRRESTPALPTLASVLDAFRNSVGAARQAARLASTADTKIASGEKELFVIEGLSVNLHVGVRFAAPTDRDASATDDVNMDAIQLDFDAPADQRSSIQFDVKLRPLQVTD